MTGTKHFTLLFAKYSVLTPGTQKSGSERICVEILFITNILSKTSDARPCLALNNSLANCLISFSCIAQDLSCSKILSKDSHSRHISVTTLSRGVRLFSYLIDRYETSRLMSNT